MRKGLRIALATATGAAVLAAGAAITTVTPANAVSAVALRAAGDILDLKSGGDLFIPPSGSDKITFSFTISNPFETTGDKKGEPKYKVWARYTTDSSASSVSWKDGTLTQLSKSTATTVPDKATVTGSISVSSSDKPGDKWKIQVAATPDSATSAPADDSAWKDSILLDVKAATRVTSANVDPDPVYLKSGKEVDVYAAFHLEKFGDEKITDVRLESKDSDDYYSLTTGLEADDSYHDSTSMDYSTSTGGWQLRISISRGTKKYSFTKAFQVSKSGTSKAKSKITLYASPSKVKKGKATKLYGKVYRGSKAWSKKILKLYFKKKGTKKWKFVGYVGATSTGKYTKSVKPKYDGYWRTTAAATSLTYGSLSNIKFVDVK